VICVAGKDKRKPTKMSEILSEAITANSKRYDEAVNTSVIKTSGEKYISRSTTPIEIIQLTVCTCGMLTNVMAIIATCHIPRDRWSLYNKLIINLAISDIFVPLSVITHVTLDFISPHDACTELTRRFLMNVALTSTLFNLVLMAVDHYLAIMYAIHYDRLFSEARVNISIVALWSTSVFCGVLEIIISISGYTDLTFPFCVHVNKDDFNYQMVIVIFVFVILLCLIILYTRICLQVHNLVKHDNLRSRHSHSFKAIITTFIIIGTFALCWCPLGMFHIVLYLQPPDPLTIDESAIQRLFLINDVLFTLLLFNSLLDPITYAVRRSEVQLGYLRMFRKLRPTRGYVNNRDTIVISIRRRRNTREDAVSAEDVTTTVKLSACNHT